MLYVCTHDVYVTNANNEALKLCVNSLHCMLDGPLDSFDVKL